MSGNRVRSLDWIKAPNHPAMTVRKPPKPETRGSNPRGPATFPTHRLKLTLPQDIAETLNISSRAYFLHAPLRLFFMFSVGDERSGGR